MKAQLAGALAALVAVGCASAPPQGPHGRQGTEGHRRGGEGMAGPRGPQLFISPSGQPFRAGPGEAYPVAAWFAQADRDHDERLTRAEVVADAETYFDALDIDRDGDIDMGEVAAYEQKVVPEIVRDDMASMGADPRGPGRGGHGGRHHAGGAGFNGLLLGAAPYSLINEAHPIRGADSDYSMRVSWAEWRAAADRRFKLLDKDGDGVVRLNDLPRTLAQGRADRSRGGGEPHRSRERP